MLQAIASAAPISLQSHITITLDPGNPWNVSIDDMKDGTHPLVQEGDDWVVASDAEPDAAIDLDHERQADASA